MSKGKDKNTIFRIQLVQEEPFVHIGHAYLEDYQTASTEFYYNGLYVRCVSDRCNTSFELEQAKAKVQDFLDLFPEATNAISELVKVTIEK